MTFTTRLTNTLFKDLNKPCVTLKCDNMLVSTPPPPPPAFPFFSSSSPPLIYSTSHPPA
eukprot:COSAG06_NODE_2431_length_6889_cov_345.528424_7_plen_59_part_00